MFKKRKDVLSLELQLILSLWLDVNQHSHFSGEEPGFALGGIFNFWNPSSISGYLENSSSSLDQGRLAVWFADVNLALNEKSSA